MSHLHDKMMTERGEPARSCRRKQKEIQMENLLIENRSRGWGSAETAPIWAQARIVEIRRAVVSKKSIPAPSRSFIAGCEKRALERRALAQPARRRSLDDNSDAAIAKRNGITVEAIQDARIRLRLKALGEQIRRERL
jgi:hypothetical protein